MRPARLVPRRERAAAGTRVRSGQRATPLGLAGSAIGHAERLVDRSAIAQETLHEIPEPAARTISFHPSAASYGYGDASALAAIMLAWLGLYRRRILAAVRLWCALHRPDSLTGA